MAKAAVTLAARGTMRSTTLQALPIEDLLEALRAGPGVAPALGRSDPPHVVLAPLFAHFVVAEQHREHGSVRAAAHPVAQLLVHRHLFCDLEATRPCLIEARSNLDAGPWVHRPIVNPGARRIPTASRPRLGC